MNIKDILMGQLVNIPPPPASPTPRTSTIPADPPQPINADLKLNDPSGRFSGLYDQHMISDIIRAAKKFGEDPMTAIAMSLQETRLGKTNGMNPMHWMNLSKEAPAFFESPDPDANNRLDALNASMQRWQDNRKYGKITSRDPETLDIQSYNGLGYIQPGLYDNPLPQNGRKDQPYGKRVVNLRDNILKPNPRIQQLLKRILGE